MQDLADRGLVVNVWSAEEVAFLIDEDGELSELDPDTRYEAAKLTLQLMKNRLLFVFADSGGEAVSELWKESVQEQVAEAFLHNEPRH